MCFVFKLLVLQRGIFQCSGKVDLSKHALKWFVYKLNQTEAFTDCMQLEGDVESKVLATSWMLPSIDFHELWENLVYENNIKRNVSCFITLNYLKNKIIFFPVVTVR